MYIEKLALVINFKEYDNKFPHLCICGNGFRSGDKLVHGGEHNGIVECSNHWNKHDYP